MLHPGDHPSFCERIGRSGDRSQQFWGRISFHQERSRLQKKCLALDMGQVEKQAACSPPREKNNNPGPYLKITQPVIIPLCSERLASHPWDQLAPPSFLLFSLFESSAGQWDMLGSLHLWVFQTALLSQSSHRSVQYP